MTARTTTSPILAVTSPTPECGKTTLLTLLSALVPRALSAANITAAATFRAVEKWRPTLLIDEADTFLRDNDDLRGVLNSGHSRAPRQGAGVPGRCRHGVRRRVHGADGDLADLRLDLLAQLDPGGTGGLHRRAGALQLTAAAPEHADLVRLAAFCEALGNPAPDGLALRLGVFEDRDLGRRSWLCGGAADNGPCRGERHSFADKSSCLQARARSPARLRNVLVSSDISDVAFSP
jgi:hypothetical protein